MNHPDAVRVERRDVAEGDAVEVEPIDLADHELALEDVFEDVVDDEPDGAALRRDVEVQGHRSGDGRANTAARPDPRATAPSRRRTRDGAPPAPGPMGIVAATPQR